jgi:hypothetical protein
MAILIPSGKTLFFVSRQNEKMHGTLFPVPGYPVFTGIPERETRVGGYYGRRK